MCVGDMDKVKQVEDLVRRNYIGGPSLMTIPDVHFSAGKVAIKPIVMKRVDLEWSDLLAYYAMIPLGCSDRMAHSVEQPEALAIVGQMRDIVRPMPCAMPPTTAIKPEDFGAYWRLSQPPDQRLAFYERVKVLQGLPPSTRGFDPTERITTTAEILCRVVREEDAEK
jgi:hypothetical protein